MVYYKIHKFKEGGTLLYHHDSSVQAVDVSINIPTGAMMDGDKPGLTHFFEHAMFCDIENKTAPHGLIKARQLNNFQNGSTYLNNVCLEFCTPLRNLEASMEHNAYMLMYSNFPKDKIEREKEVVINEMLMVNNHSADMRDVMFSNLISYCYGTDNNLFTSLIGTEESIRSITREDLLEYREKYFNRNNVIICMAGNISYEEAKRLCKKYIISKMPPSGPMLIPEIENVYLHRNLNFIYSYSESPSSILQFCFPLNGKQNYKNYVLSNFLDKALNRKIFDKLRLKEGLVYSPSISNIQFSNDGLKIIEIETRNEKSNACMREIAKIVGELVKEGIKEEEFLSIKQEFIDAESLGYGNSVIGKASDMFRSYINNDRIYTDKEKSDIFKFLTCQDLNDYVQKVLNTSEVIVNFMGDRFIEELYNPEQIQALFMLNRFTPEQLEESGYTIPDMGCPCEYANQLMLEKFSKDKRKAIDARWKKKSSNKNSKKDKIKKYLDNKNINKNIEECVEEIEK